MATAEMVERAMMRMALVFPDRKMLAEAVEVYREGLRDVPDKVLWEASGRCVKECRFFPTVREIRDRAEPMMQAEMVARGRLLENDRLARCRAAATYEPRYDIPVCSEVGTCNLEVCRIWELFVDLRARWEREHPAEFAAMVERRRLK